MSAHEAIDFHRWRDAILLPRPDVATRYAWAAEIMQPRESALEEWFLLLLVFRWHDCRSVSYRSLVPPPRKKPKGRLTTVDFDNQVKVAGSRCDFLVTITSTVTGASTRLAVECDGHTYHDRTARQASQDRARDRKLLRKGIPTVRYTFTDLIRAPDESLLDLHQTIIALSEQLRRA